MTDSGTGCRAIPSVLAARGIPAVVFSLFLLALPPTGIAAEAILVERPHRVTGIEYFPTLPIEHHAALYSLEETTLEVFYTAATIELGDAVATMTCGPHTLSMPDDPDVELRVVEIDEDTVVFAWPADRDLPVCAFLPQFVERYRFFRRAFPDDRGAWLPAVVELTP